tara:strand:- start:2181 stop:2414 length:234 start_codon:yes stop_codon:yes gene_type:complete
MSALFAFAKLQQSEAGAVGGGLVEKFDYPTKLYSNYHPEQSPCSETSEVFFGNTEEAKRHAYFECDKGAKESGQLTW